MFNVQINTTCTESGCSFPSVGRKENGRSERKKIKINEKLQKQHNMAKSTESDRLHSIPCGGWNELTGDRRYGEVQAPGGIARLQPRSKVKSSASLYLSE